MQVGDLVTKRLDEEGDILFGIVLKMDDIAIKVLWDKDYGTFWALQETVRIEK